MLFRAKDRIDNELPLRGNTQILLRQKLHEFLFGALFFGNRHAPKVYARGDKSQRNLRRGDCGLAAFLSTSGPVRCQSPTAMKKVNWLALSLVEKYQLANRW